MRNILIYVIVIFLLFSCKGRTSRNAENFKIRDYFDREVAVPPKINILVPIYYVQAEIICAIGAAENIKGIGKISNASSNFITSNFPSLIKLPQVGQGNNIDFEKLISLKPDIVFTGTERPVVNKMEQLGLTVIATYPKNMKEILSEILFYGEVLNKKDKALRIFNLFIEIYSKVDSISKFIAKERFPKVYYVRTDALTTVGGTLQGEIFEKAGGTLVTNGIGDNSSSLQISLEDIYRYNPDVIILRDRASITPDDIYSDVKWKHIRAVKNKAIYKEHSGWTEYRLETVFGLIEKAKWLHPLLYSELQPEYYYHRFINIVHENGKQ